MNGNMGLKEWASICLAQAEGNPLVLLRKGGIGDAGPGRPDGLFWLVPTWVHQQEQGLRPECRDLLSRAEALRPPAGTLRLSLAARLLASWGIAEESVLPELRSFHAMTDETVAKRFHYRKPGLQAWLLRVWKRPAPLDLPWNPVWDGCVSWMDLGAEHALAGVAKPTADESVLTTVYERLAKVLGPASAGPFPALGECSS